MDKDVTPHAGLQDAAAQRPCVRMLSLLHTCSEGQMSQHYYSSIIIDISIIPTIIGVVVVTMVLVVVVVIVIFIVIAIIKQSSNTGDPDEQTLLCGHNYLVLQTPQLIICDLDLADAHHLVRYRSYCCIWLLLIGGSPLAMRAICYGIFDQRGGTHEVMSRAIGLQGK